VEGFNGAIKCPSSSLAKELCGMANRRRCCGVSFIVCSILDEAPSVDVWPTITSVKPSTGPVHSFFFFLQYFYDSIVDVDCVQVFEDGDEIVVSGTGLSNVVKVVVGTRVCTRVQKTSSTSVTCEFDKQTGMFVVWCLCCA
jgi:hypothetical protein